eukprot:2834048-Rhodomonas_salina.2
MRTSGTPEVLCGGAVGSGDGARAGIVADMCRSTHAQRNHVQEDTIFGHFEPGMRFRVCDFGVDAP